MRTWTGPALAVLIALAAAATPRAIALTLSGLDVERALNIAKGSEASRAAFHAPYITTFNSALVESIEVVTEFRRVELLGEDRVRFGDFMFSVQKAQSAVAPFKGKVAIRARLRFNPQNAYVTVPAYDVTVGPAGELPPPAVLDVTRNAIFATPSQAKRPAAGQPILGEVVEALFDAAAIGQTLRSVGVVFDGKTVALATVNFSRIE